eukprot:3979472-Prymnesium_polylepis.1
MTTGGESSIRCFPIPTRSISSRRRFHPVSIRLSLRNTAVVVHNVESPVTDDETRYQRLLPRRNR